MNNQKEYTNILAVDPKKGVDIKPIVDIHLFDRKEFRGPISFFEVPNLSLKSLILHKPLEKFSYFASDFLNLRILVLFEYSQYPAL